jgi:hypothetical protein
MQNAQRLTQNTEKSKGKSRKLNAERKMHNTNAEREHENRKRHNAKKRKTLNTVFSVERFALSVLH